MQQQQTCTNRLKDTVTQNKHEILKPGLVALYNIRPGNGLCLLLRPILVSSTASVVFC